MDRKPKNMGYGMVIPRWSSHHRTKRFPASPQSAEAMGDLQAWRFDGLKKPWDLPKKN